MAKIIMMIKNFFEGSKKSASCGEALLNVLEYMEGSIHIAHCLEFDIVAEGASRDEAREKLADLIREQVLFTTEKDIEEKALFHPAPEHYWKVLHRLRTRQARRALLEDDPKHLTARDILGCMESTNASFAGQTA